MISTIVLVLLCLILLGIWKVKTTFSYWKDKGIPHHTLTEYINDEWTKRTVPFNEHAVNCYKKLPKIFGSYQGFNPKLIIGDPELIKQVLVKDFNSFSDRFVGPKINHKIWDSMVLNATGEEWKRLRGIITPAFSSGKMKNMIAAVDELAGQVVEQFLEDARRGRSSDIKKAFGAFSMDSIAKLAFATKLNSHKDPDNPFIKYGKGIFGPDNTWKVTLFVMFPALFKLFRMTFLSEENIQFFASVAKKIVEERTAGNKKGNDMLQMLLNTRKDEDSADSNTSRTSDKKKDALSMDEIISQVVLFFLAAYDTTTAVLLFTTYNLVVNPEKQDKLIEEIDRVVGKGPVTYEALAEMPYLDAAINENLRLVGTDPFILRACTEDTTLAGIPIKKGSVVEILMPGIHRDPEYFPEPEKYIPERFLPENKSSIAPYTFFPFGDGPRHCIGMRLALFEMKVCLIRVFQRFRFEICPETSVPMKFMPKSLTPEPQVPILLKAVERT